MPKTKKTAVPVTTIPADPLATTVVTMEEVRRANDMTPTATTTSEPPKPPVEKSEWEAKFIVGGEGWTMYRLRHVKTQRADVFVVRPDGPCSWTWQKLVPNANGFGVSNPYLATLDTDGDPHYCPCKGFLYAAEGPDGKRLPCKHLRATVTLAKKELI